MNLNIRKETQHRDRQTLLLMAGEEGKVYSA